ncbi:MAG: ADP-dependent glucokinase/phosphofructokinase [Candidatus Nanohaloarchaea archaeon]
MRDTWIRRYREAAKTVEKSFDALIGFNSNIDVVHQAGDIDLELEGVEPELVKKIGSEDDLKRCLKYCMVEEENHEVDLETSFSFSGEERIGGQAGIMSQFLSGTGNGTIFYTPLLSEELAAELNEKILYPVNDGGFMLKNVRDAANTDRTKRNHIFEFESGKSGRLIVSDTLKGFGPYFRKSVEENLDVIEDNVDCVLVSGFHDVKGNADAKLKKSSEQLSKLDSPVHLEFVHRNNELSKKILGQIAPCVDSIGLDETEFKKVSELALDTRPEGKVNLGEAFEHSKNLLKRLNLQRVHLHTYRYHLTVTEDDYHAEPEKIRKSMLYGELAAIQSADTGEIPDSEQVRDFDMDDKKIHMMTELEDFGRHLEIDDFAREGIAELEEVKAVAVPTIIHNDPVRTVGMGDIISSGAFGSEFKDL